MRSDLDNSGFSILPGVFDEPEIRTMTAALSAIVSATGVRSRGGTYAMRNLLQLSAEVRALAWSVKVRSIANDALGEPAFPVRATLFDKTPGANWLVPWHQDLTICVRNRIETPGYGPWTNKAGVWHVQPPAAVLERMLSLRIHLDDCGERNGALRAIPGTHRSGRLTADEIAERRRTSDAVTCVVDRGGVILMRPLLVHASSPAAGPTHRRVIHIDYAACRLDGGVEWVID